MAEPRRFRRLLRLPLRPSAGREVDEEFRFHLEMRTEQLRARGMDTGPARAEALRQFGDVDDARRYCRDVDARRWRERRRGEWWRDLLRDVRHALRGLRRQPGFAATIVVTLALGIGANVVMLDTVDRLLLRPPPHIVQPELVRRLYYTTFDDGEDDTEPHMSWPLYETLRETMRSSAGIGVFYRVPMIVGEGAGARQGQVTLATPGFFTTLGVRPALGRFFAEAEDVPPVGTRVAVLSHEVWRRDFGGRRDAIGATVVVGGTRFQVVGVAPPGFTGVDLERTDVWVPVSALAGEIITTRLVELPWHQARNVGWIRGIARIPDAAAAARVQGEATAGFRRSVEARRGAARADSLRPRATLEPLLVERGPDRTPSARIAVWLAGMALVVLLIACANVANLLLARALRRRREIAVRVALGAGRGRLVRQLLAEGVLLALLGGAGALLVAWWGGGVVRGILVPDVAAGGSLLDARVLAIAAAVALLGGVLTALLPALQSTSPDLVGALKSGAREGGARRSLTRGALVVAQAALSLVLLVGAGLFLRSLHAARSVELGYAADRVLTVNLDLTGAGYSSAEAVALHERLHERLARLPGVEHASIGMTTPFATTLDIDIRLPGRDSVPLPPSGAPRLNVVTPEFFATMGTRVVEGRAIAPGDRRGAPPVTVINRTMARALWPGRSPIGECVILPDEDGQPCVEVVGVAEDARWSDLRDDPPMQMYFALAQGVFEFPLRVIFLRVAGEPAPVIGAVRREVREAAPRILFAEVEPLAANLEPEMRPWRLGATMFTVFGALALVLAGLGLYSVIAYDVAQRVREMGIRIALGAGTGDILRLVVWRGIRMAALGVALGTAIALAAGRWVGDLLFDTSPADPLVLGGVVAVLLAVAAAACLLPARRATRVPPGVALRAE